MDLDHQKVYGCTKEQLDDMFKRPFDAIPDFMPAMSMLSDVQEMMNIVSEKLESKGDTSSCQLLDDARQTINRVKYWMTSGMRKQRPEQTPGESRQVSVAGIYVPVSAELQAAIEPKSGIVGINKNDGNVLIYYEGNLHGASNLETYEERVKCAAGRMFTRYPTSAMRNANEADLMKVGEVVWQPWDRTSRVQIKLHGEEAMHLAAYLQDVPTKPRGNRP